MKTATKLVFGGAAAVALGAAVARVRRELTPRDAVAPPPSALARSRPPVAPARFELPDDVVHHRLDTPDGGTIHAIERGSGRPLVLIHGITLRSDVWAPQLRDLADRYRVISVDLRGHGESRAGDAGYGIDRLADDLATLLCELDLRGAVVVGHSMGGMTAMAFCGRHPDVLAERVAGLVFVATRAHRVLPPSVDRAARSLLARSHEAALEGERLPGAEQINARGARLAFGEQPSPVAVGLVAEMGASMEPEALALSLAGLIEHDAREALRTTHTPSLVVVGTRDLLTPVPAASHLAHLLPDSELVVLPRAGHQLMQERPDELAELIDGFARRLP
ncbi:MAG: alpha/beta fold hydrolase [Acidimicrobiales bacterium]|nr:alpha/beta fold hydrolase [Acidimicrobiales bacterium]